jgi:hypothetical protein
MSLDVPVDTLFWMNKNDSNLEAAILKFLEELKKTVGEKVTQSEMTVGERQMVKYYMLDWAKANGQSLTFSMDTEKYFAGYDDNLLTFDALWCMMNYLLSFDIDPF